MMGVAFGLFGTLVAEAERLVPAARAVALRESQRLGVTLDEAALDDALHAPSHAAIAERIVALVGPRGRLTAIEAQIRAEEAALVRESAIAPMVRETLAELSSLNLPRAVLTNGASALARRAAAIAGFDGPVLVAEDIGVRKPDPAAFAFLAEALSLPADRIWYVTSKVVDLRAAQAAGFRTVALALNEREGNAANAVAQHRIERLDELLPLLAEPYTRSLLGIRYVVHNALAWRAGHFVPGVEYGLGEPDV